MNSKVELFWSKYISSLPFNNRPVRYSAWGFGNTAQMKDELAALVLNGPKRATTSLKWIYEKFPVEKMPEVGELSVVLNSKDEPVCIIQTISVETRKLNEVDESYAYLEGEGDRSLQYWRDVHWRFFSGECDLIGCVPSEDMPVICEAFKVVYPAASADHVSD